MGCTFFIMRFYRYLLLTFLLYASSMYGQLYNKTYKLGHISSSFSNIYKADSSVFCTGLSETADTTQLVVLTAEIHNDGRVIRSSSNLLDSFITFSPNIHSGIQLGSDLSYCAASYVNSIGYTFDIDQNTLSMSTHKYLADTALMRFNILYSITLPSANKFYIGNYQNQAYQVSYFLLKTDSAGNELWRHYYPVDTRFNRRQNPSSISLLLNGHMLIGGLHGNMIGGSPFSTATMFVEVDTLGTIIRSWEDNNSRTFSPCQVVEMPNTDIIYATTWADSFIVPTSTETYPLQRGYIVRMDTAHNKLWELKLGRSCTPTSFNQMKQLSDGNFLAVGNTFDSLAIADSLVQSGWLVKFTPQGQVLWQRRYYGFHSTYYEINHLYDFVELANGDIIACGEAQDWTLPSYIQQGWLLRLNSEGCLIDGCERLAVDMIGPDAFLHLYPNPNTGSFNLESVQSLGSEYNVTDMLGQIVHQGQIKSDNQNINLSELTDGVYTLTFNKAGQYANIRFTILH